MKQFIRVLRGILRAHEATPFVVQCSIICPFDNTLRNFKLVGSHGRTRVLVLEPTLFHIYKGLADESLLTGNFSTREKECHSPSAFTHLYAYCAIYIYRSEIRESANSARRLNRIMQWQYTHIIPRIPYSCTT